MARLVVLTPNPAVDVTYRVARQVLGETVRVEAVERRPGGKGLNVVRVLRALGHEALALQPLGGDTGRWVREELEAAGLPTEVVEVEGRTRTTVAVVDDVIHPTLLAEPGPALPPQAWAGLVAAVGAVCEQGGVLVVSGSFPPGTGAEEVRALVGAAHRAGARVVADTSGPPLVAAVEAGADLVKPNADEALAATGAADLETAVAALLARGAAAVVVSRGADGLLAATADGERVEQPAVPGVHGNPTGAGDAATAGLVAALERGAPLVEALRWAAVLGAAAVLRPTAGEVDLDDVAALADRLPGGAPRHPPLPRPTSERPTAAAARRPEPRPA